MGTIKKIKICHLASGDLWAGAEVMLASLVKALKQYDFLEVSAILCNRGILEENLKAMDVPIRVISEAENNPLQLLIKIRNQLAAEKPTILHTHRYKENFLGALAARMSGVRHIVCTVHGMAEPFRGLKNVKSSIYNFLNLQVQRFLLEKVITVSNDIRRTLTKKIKPSKLATVHNGIDLDRLKNIRPRNEIRRELSLPDDALVLGSVGRMMPVKGYEYLLRACKLIFEKDSHARLIMVGEGPLRGRLESYAADLGIAGKVIFPGFLPETADIINAMDIFVLSSLHEGISISLLESLALGIPAVVTDVGGNPEVLEDGRHGRLVPPRDSNALVEACLGLANDSEKRLMMGNMGRDYIKANFSKEAMAEKMQRIYLDLIKE